MNVRTGQDIIERKGVKLTSNRILVINALLKADHPISLTDLELNIETMDKSSIYRVLTVFLDNDIVHGIEDGSGSLKYEICSGVSKCTISDMHVHFYCESCHSTFCFESTHIPTVQLPAGFHTHSVNYMVKGLCPDCQRRNSEK